MIKICLTLVSCFIIIVSCGKREQKTKQVSVSKVLTIVEKGINSVGFYTEDGVHIKSLKLDTIPHEMRFSPDRKFAYITNTGTFRYYDDGNGGETISVINLQKMEKEPDISLYPYRRPHGIDIDPVTGYLAVGVEIPNQILLIDPLERKILKTFDNHGEFPHMVTISKGAKWIYASNISSSNLVGINTTTGEHFSIDVGSKPQESVLSPDESILYVACNDYISVIDLKARKEISQIPNGANRLDLIQNGELLVFSSRPRFGIGFANAKNYKMIYRLDIPYKPYSIHVSEDEKLAYVSAEEQNVVYTIDINSKKIIRKFYPGEGIRPDPVQDFILETPITVNKKEFNTDIPSFERIVLDTSFYKGYQIISADINGDEKPDLVAVSDRLPEVVWFENPSWEKHIMHNNTLRNIDIAPYDIDGDGYIDVALACGFNIEESTKGGYVYWLQNPGENFESEWEKHFIDSLPSSHRLRWVDINGYGSKVLVNLPLMGVGAKRPDFNIPMQFVYYNIPANPKQDNWPISVIDSTLRMAHGLTITRWDNDLKEDIITASFEGLTLYRSTNTGWEKSSLSTGHNDQNSIYTGSSEVSVGRLGNNLKKFLVSIEPWHGNEVVVYTENDKKEWTRSIIDTTFNGGHALQCFDLNYDGFDEIIAGYREVDYNLYIYQYLPEQNIWERRDLDKGGMSAAGVHVFDANLDGIPDIVACGSFTENVVLYLGKNP